MRSSFRRFMAEPLTVRLTDGTELDGYLKEDAKGVLVLHGDDTGGDVLVPHERILYAVIRKA